MDNMVKNEMKDSIGRTYYICSSCNKNRHELLNINNELKCKYCHKLTKNGDEYNKEKLRRIYNQLNPDLTKPNGMDDRYFTYLIVEMGRLLNAGARL